MKNEITPFNKVEEIYQDYFYDLTKIDGEDIIIKESCEFCKHPQRHEAEMEYERTGNFSQVAKYLANFQKDHPEFADIPLSSVKTHLLSHYVQQQRQIWMKEYGNRLVSVMNKKISDEKRLDAMKHMFEIKLLEIASNPLLDEFKKVDAMTKLSTSIMNIMTTSAELKGDIQTVNVIEEKLTTVWFNMIDRQANPEIKKILAESLETFQENLDQKSSTE